MKGRIERHMRGLPLKKRLDRLSGEKKECAADIARKVDELKGLLEARGGEGGFTVMKALEGIAADYRRISGDNSDMEIGKVKDTAEAIMRDFDDFFKSLGQEVGGKVRKLRSAVSHYEFLERAEARARAHLEKISKITPSDASGSLSDYTRGVFGSDSNRSEWAKIVSRLNREDKDEGVFPIFILPLKKPVKEKIISGYNIEAIQLMPPNSFSKNVGFNVMISKAGKARKTGARSGGGLSFKWKPSGISPSAHRYMGVDLNRLSSPRAAAVRVINAGRLAKYLEENVLSGGYREDSSASGEEGNDSGALPDPLSLPGDLIPSVETYPLGSTAGIGETGNDKGVANESEPEGVRALKLDIQFLLGFTSEPISEYTDAFIGLWKKVEKAVLSAESRPDEGMPYYIMRKDCSKDYDTLNYLDYLMAPVIYWAEKRFHLRAHESAISRSISTLVARKAGYRASPSQNGPPYLYYPKLSRLVRERRLYFRRSTRIRNEIVRYLIRLFAYLIAVLHPSRVIYERLSMKPRKGKSKSLNKIIQDMIKGLDTIRDDIIETLNSWGIREIPPFESVAAYNTSTYAYPHWARMVIARWLFDEERVSFTPPADLRDKKEFEEYRQLLRSWYLISVRSPLRLSDAYVDREGSSDWGICYFTVVFYKAQMAQVSTGYVINTHENAACNVAFRYVMDTFLSSSEESAD